jgi:hypothetical protein
LAGLFSALPAQQAAVNDIKLSMGLWILLPNCILQVKNRKEPNPYVLLVQYYPFI